MTQSSTGLASFDPGYQCVNLEHSLFLKYHPLDYKENRKMSVRTDYT